jgi:uncharacterized protein (TIGR02413 family)
MTFNILFFSITFKKRIYSAKELEREMEINKMTEELRDRKCNLRHLF